MKLDKNRPHGIISGFCTAYPNARYTQNGHYFDGKGDQIDAETLPGQVEESEQRQRYVDANDGQAVAPPPQQQPKQEEESELLEGSEPAQENETPEVQTNELVMDKTDDELAEMAASGIGALRAYADPFGIKGTSKKEIIRELKALRK